MTRTALFVLPFTALSLAVGTAAAGTFELTDNGDFETGTFDGWSLFPTGDDQFTIISPGFDSDFAGCITNSVTPSAALMKQANVGVGEVVPEETVTISFMARGTLAVGGVAFAEFFSEIEGGGVSSSEILGGAPLALDPDPEVWTAFNFIAVTGPDVSGGVTLQLTATTGADPASFAQVYYDEVSITIDRAVPTETGSWGRIKNLYD